MPSKLLRIYEAEYLKALCYADAYGCDLNLLQFACARYLDTDEYQQLREYLESRGVGV